MMVWSDAIIAHPEILSALPKDIVLCHWSYGTGALEGMEHYRPGLELIAGSGFPFFVCPCTWSMMKLHPDLAVMRANHDSFLPPAKCLGAKGMMTTIWGDLGHMNLLGLEPYALAYAARHAWEDDPAPELDFGAAYSWTIFRDQDGHASRLALVMDRMNQVLAGQAHLAGVGFLLLFAEPLDASLLAGVGPDPAIRARELRQAREEAAAILEQMEKNKVARSNFWRDYELPLLQLDYLAGKLEAIEHLKAGWPRPGSGVEPAAFLSASLEKCDLMARATEACLTKLEERWLVNAKLSDLALNRERYGRLIRAWQERSRQVRSLLSAWERGEPLPSRGQVFAAPFPFDDEVVIRPFIHRRQAAPFFAGDVDDAVFDREDTFRVR
jgi:hypothetical protein